MATELDASKVQPGQVWADNWGHVLVLRVTDVVEYSNINYTKNTRSSSETSVPIEAFLSVFKPVAG